MSRLPKYLFPFQIFPDPSHSGSPLPASAAVYWTRAALKAADPRQLQPGAGHHPLQADRHARGIQ